MPSSREATLFHAPQTRSTGALTLLEELGADYRLQVLDLKAGQQREPAIVDRALQRDPAAYSTSLQERPAFVRAAARDAELSTPS
ncbi:MAG: hypothetical protein R3E75_11455 [Steroidobacteraceae bacterium]